MSQDKSQTQSADQKLIEIAHRFQLAGIHLWPVVSHGQTSDSLSHLRRHGIDRSAADRLPEKLASVDKVSTPLILLTPVADLSKARQISASHQAVDIIATVDHFAQIEILQQAASEFHAIVKVLVAVNSGANFFGCRPGTDSLQLAQAMSKLPNLLFSGLTSEVPATRTVDDISLEDSAISALHETAFKIQSKGMKCSFMHLRTHSVVSPSRIPTGWHISLPFSKIATMANTASEMRSEVTQGMTATIIARPSLQAAVIDHGFRTLQKASGIVLTSTNERLPIERIDEDRCVLDMSAATTELSIGQQIQFSMDG